jgi:hypothetical protein
MKAMTSIGWSARILAWRRCSPSPAARARKLRRLKGHLLRRRQGLAQRLRQTAANPAHHRGDWRLSSTSTSGCTDSLSLRVTPVTSRSSRAATSSASSPRSDKRNLFTQLDANQQDLSARFASNPALANAQFVAMYFGSLQRSYRRRTTSFARMETRAPRAIRRFSNRSRCSRPTSQVPRIATGSGCSFRASRTRARNSFTGTGPANSRHVARHTPPFRPPGPRATTRNFRVFSTTHSSRPVSSCSRSRSVERAER